MHAKAMSPVPMGISLYLFEVQLSVFNTFVLFYPELLDVSLVAVRKKKCQLSLPCGEEGEVSAQFARLPKSEKCILCLFHWEHVVL